jgi:sporulation integral membrane protein YtvI
MTIEKRRQFIINFLYFAIILGIAIFLTRYALGVLMPFLIALIVSLLLRPLVQFLRDKVHLHKGFSGIFVVLLFYALIGFLLIILGVQVFSALKSFFIRLPSIYTNSIIPWVQSAFASLETFTAKLDPDVSFAYNALASNLTTSLGETVVNVSRQVVTSVTNITLKTPGFLLKLIITVIATLFLSIDFPKVRAFVLRQLSEKNRDLLHNINVQLGRTLGRYTRSYALIMFITFAEISVGLTIIGFDNAFALAALIAVFDILPVVGSGMVLLPWTIITLISGNYTRTIGLAILYVVVIVVRNIMEPKIVGDRVGLHPLVTLLSMVLGTFIFGGIGLLGLPVTLALIHSLNREGVIHLYKTEPVSDTPKDSSGSGEGTVKKLRTLLSKKQKK